jgi:hypothetical protein
MKPWIRLVALASAFAAVALAGLATTPQASGETTQTRRLFERLSSSVAWISPDGCTSTQTGIDANQVTMLAPSAEDAPYYQRADFVMWSIDVCAPGNPLTFLAGGELTLDAFTISDKTKLSSARVIAHGTLVNDLDGSLVPVRVDVVATPSGKVEHGAASFWCDGEGQPRCETVYTHAEATTDGVIDVAGVDIFENAAVERESTSSDSWELVNWPCFPCP